MAGTYYLTPTLIVGDPSWDAVHVRTAAAAAEVILGGGSASLPDTDEGWNHARHALGLLGLTDGQVRTRETFAKTGRLS